MAAVQQFLVRNINRHHGILNCPRTRHQGSPARLHSISRNLPCPLSGTIDDARGQGDSVQSGWCWKGRTHEDMRFARQPLVCRKMRCIMRRHFDAHRALCSVGAQEMRIIRQEYLACLLQLHKRGLGLLSVSWCTHLHDSPREQTRFFTKSKHGFGLGRKFSAERANVCSAPPPPPPKFALVGPPEFTPARKLQGPLLLGFGHGSDGYWRN